MPALKDRILSALPYTLTVAFREISISISSLSPLASQFLISSVRAGHVDTHWQVCNKQTHISRQSNT